MARESLILICASLIVMQLAIVLTQDDIDYTTIHDELRKLGATLRKKCVAETGVAEDALEEAEMGEFEDDGNKLACYFRCVMEKGGVMKKDGSINFKLLTKMMPPQFKKIGLDMLEDCKDITGKDRCEAAYNFNVCMYNSNPVAYFVI